MFNYSLKSYPFGYNTQVKDTNIADDVYHARFWEYDAKVALRWNVDPKPNACSSSYSVFAANPIWFSDVMGDTLDIGSQTQSRNDVLSIVNSKNRQYIQIINNRVILNFGDLTQKQI